MNKIGLIVFNDKELTLEVNLDKDNKIVWLTLDQIVSRFSRERTVVLKHLNNIYKEDELSEDSTCANFAKFRIVDEKDMKKESNKVAFV